MYRLKVVIEQLVNKWNQLIRYVVHANVTESYQWRLGRFMDGNESWKANLYQELPRVDRLTSCGFIYLCDFNDKN